MDWHQKAFEERVQTLGRDHPGILWSLNSLGIVLAELGCLSEAIETQLQALEGQKRVFGEMHKHTVWTKLTLKSLGYND
jgi:hypothetical protein